MIEQGLLVVALMATTAPAFAESPYVDRYHSDAEVHRMEFMAAYQAAHMAELGAFCVGKNATVERLRAELMVISARVQERNPDVDLSSLEATTGLDISRFSVGEAERLCAATSDLAITKFTTAMANLRKFTKKWR